MTSEQLITTIDAIVKKNPDAVIVLDSVVICEFRFRISFLVCSNMLQKRWKRLIERVGKISCSSQSHCILGILFKESWIVQRASCYVF